MEDLLTARLQLRALQVDDAPFIYQLVNDPDWLAYIGDKGVHNLDDARNYIINGPQAMYQRNGFGLLVVETLQFKQPLGLCGLLQRDNLPVPDVGFAFLPTARNQGYAAEAARAVIEYGFSRHQLNHLAAITAPHNHASIGLLKKLGFVQVGSHKMSDNAADSNLFELLKTAWAR